MEKVGLSEAIAALRQELTMAVRAGSEETLKFQVGQITIELEVAVERVTSGAGGLKFWVLEVTGETARATTRTHRIVVPLTPIDRDGGIVLTGDDLVPN